jgi:hypothetical protein
MRKTPAMLSFAVAAMSCVRILADSPIKIADLPAPVRNAVERETAGSKVKGFFKEVERGVTSYEVETEVSSRSRDLSFDTQGKLLAVEEETTLDALPASAKAAIERRAAGGKVTKNEKITAGRQVSYEAGITKNGRRTEFTVAADGTAKK